MNYPSYPNQISAQGLTYPGGVAEINRNTTLAENIDLRIADMKDKIARLEAVKTMLAEPGGLLGVPIEDLRYAMSY